MTSGEKILNLCLVRWRAYGARDSFCYLSQPLPFDSAQGERAGLTFVVPTALTQRKTIWGFTQRGADSVGGVGLEMRKTGELILVLTRRLLLR